MPKLTTGPSKVVVQKGAATKAASKKAGKKAAKPQTPATPAKSEPVPMDDRDVTYESISVKLYQGDDALTSAEAKKYLGWHEVETGDYILKDVEGAKIQLSNNLSNRPYDHALAETYKSDILHGRWRLNGETMVVGRTGITISMQHRAVGLVLAVQEWIKDPDRWPHWTSEPTLECIIVRGVEETDEYVNTHDTGRGRTLTDVVYRTNYFSSIKSESGKRKASKALEYAVRLLWHRTGAKLDAYAPIRSHGESLEFIDNHKRLIACVKHVLEEDGGERQIGQFVPVGTAAGLMYMMGSSKSDAAAYKENRIESALDWSLLDDANDFWAKLAAGDKELSPLRTMLGKLLESPEGVSSGEKTAIVVKAWIGSISGKPVTDKTLELTYAENDNGVRYLNECPTVGGIDLGNPKDVAGTHGAKSDDDTAETTTTETKGKKPKAGKTGKPKIGSRVWVSEDGGHWIGTVEEVYDVPNGSVCKVRSATGKIWDVPMPNCSLSDPNG